MNKVLAGAVISIVLLAGCSNGVENSKENGKANDSTPTEIVTTPDNSQEQDIADVKTEYMNKLNAVEESLADLAPLNEEGTTASMIDAATQTFERWDKALNEVYAALQEKLTDEEMDKLKNEQVAWNSERDEKASVASKQYEGGTMESLEYISTKAQLTKERSYELVKQYM